jgi:hypothetical protein
MPYELFDNEDKVVTLHQLQNRGVWYKHGNTKEEVFINAYGQTLGVVINPDKENDPTLPDLVFQEHLADLKCQNTPLFYADKDYKTPAQYAVTFNLKDALHYGPLGKHYERLTIFYWIDWVARKMITSGNREYAVDKLTGVWRIDYSRLEDLRLRKPIHWYYQRGKTEEQNPDRRQLLPRFEPRLQEGDHIWAVRGFGDNAACSYVFDLREFERVI